MEKLALDLYPSGRQAISRIFTQFFLSIPFSYAFNGSFWPKYWPE